MTNPADPLNKTENAERELFQRMASVASGFSLEHVVGATANLLVNAIRQNNATQRAALAIFDEMTANVRAVLAEHYDGMGKRRNIFPFHQRIEVPLFDARPKNNGRAN